MSFEKIIWFTGQPGAGKTTLARALHELIPGSVWIDGDDLRNQTGNQDYSDQGRAANVREAQRRAVKAIEDGRVAIVSLVSPFRCQREDFKAAHNVLEIYVHPCRVSGKAAFAFPAYAPPLLNFIDVNTTGRGVADCAAQIAGHLQERLSGWGT